MLKPQDEIEQLMRGVTTLIAKMRDGLAPRSKYTYRDLDKMIIQASYRAHEMR